MGSRSFTGASVGVARGSCPWQASVYSKQDGKKIRKLFATKAEAQSCETTHGQR